MTLLLDARLRSWSGIWDVRSGRLGVQPIVIESDLNVDPWIVCCAATESRGQNTGESAIAVQSTATSCWADTTLIRNHIPSAQH